MFLAVPGVEHPEQVRLRQTLGALHRWSDDPQRTAPHPTAPNLAPHCQSDHEKAIRWLNPICSLHRLALLPLVLGIILDFHSCQLVVPHQHLFPARSGLPPLSPSPPHLGFSSRLENDFTASQETRCSECSGKPRKQLFIYHLLNIRR